MQLRRQQKKEDYSLIRNEISQEQVMSIIYFICLMLAVVAVFFAYIAFNYYNL